MTDAKEELLAAGEALLRRREAIEHTIVREFRGTRTALVVQAAQVERQRERVRVELLRIVHEVDESETEDEEYAAGEEESDEAEGFYAASDEEEGGEAEGFYAARERLVGRDRELLQAIEALRRRAGELVKAKAPPKLVELERDRELLETQLRQWRGRCRSAGLALDLPRWDEYASSSEAD